MDEFFITIIKTIGSIIVYPAVLLVGYFAKRLVNRLDQMDDKIKELDKFQEVHRNQLLDIKEDIKNINYKLDKIIDKLTS